MLRVPYIRAHKPAVIAGLQKRHFAHLELIDQVLESDALRRKTQNELDHTAAKSNALSRELGRLLQSGKQQEVESLRRESASLKTDLKALQKELSDIQQGLHHILLQIPNIPHPSVQAGQSEGDNEELSRHGRMPQLGEDALPHWDLASQYGLFDLKMGVKVAGSGFPVYQNQGARLQRILIEYCLQKNIAAGYTEYFLPYLINETSGYGTGQLPDKERQMYQIQSDALYAIPTGEVSMMNCFRDRTLDEAELPIKATAHTPCFRREAGSYGKGVRGLNRLHQFEKVEIVQITRPEDSHKALDEMVAQVQRLIEDLELPYRILRLCGGDMGFTASITYDFEVYAAAQRRWLEVSSVSNTADFQTNRLRLRYRNGAGQTVLCHALNGSALALARIYAALLENNQTDRGIALPQALAAFSGMEFLK